MKRCLAIGVIAVYLGSLLFGIAAHALNFKADIHPAMYFVVWDMFCGWAGYENRTHIIGEGESGRFYQLAPGPWGDFNPFGDISRHHYDPFVNHTGAIALNSLRHTDHEPMQRIFVVDEVWAKKFNLSDELWQKRYTEPKQPQSYFHLRQVLDGEGRLVTLNPGWFDYQAQLCLSDNPRIWREAQQGKPFYQVNPLQRSDEHFTETAGVAAPMSGMTQELAAAK